MFSVPVNLKGHMRSFTTVIYVFKSSFTTMRSTLVFVATMEVAR